LYLLRVALAMLANELCADQREDLAKQLWVTK